MSLFLVLLIISTEYLRVSLSQDVSENEATLIDLILKYKIATVEQKYDSQLEIIGKKQDYQQEELENLKTKQKEIENYIINENVKSTLFVDIQSQIAQEKSTRHRHEKEIQALQSGFRSIKMNIRSIQIAFFQQKSIIKNISLWEPCDKIDARMERLEEHLKQISRDALCGAPPSVTNTDVDITTTMDESTATYTCINDFASSGSGDIVCQADGKWSRLGLTCTKHSIICEGRRGNIACPAGQAITIANVNYGRKQFDPCPHHARRDLNCVSGPTVTRHVESVCNNLNSCRLTASNSINGDPCYGTYKYLDIAYSCF